MSAEQIQALWVLALIFGVLISIGALCTLVALQLERRARRERLKRIAWLKQQRNETNRRNEFLLSEAERKFRRRLNGEPE